MPASTVKAVKTAILAALAANGDLAGVQQSWGGPTEGDDTTAEEAIYLGDIVDLEQAWASLGDTPVQRQEEYIVPVFVAVWRYGDEERATEERAWELVEEVKSSLLSATGILEALTPGAEALFRVAGQINQPFGPQRWRTIIRLEMACSSRLRG
jgi:hypothetical protein